MSIFIYTRRPKSRIHTIEIRCHRLMWALGCKSLRVVDVLSAFLTTTIVAIGVQLLVYMYNCLRCGYAPLWKPKMFAFSNIIQIYLNRNTINIIALSSLYQNFLETYIWFHMHVLCDIVHFSHSPYPTNVDQHVFPHHK